MGESSSGDRKDSGDGLGEGGYGGGVLAGLSANPAITPRWEYKPPACLVTRFGIETRHLQLLSSSDFSPGEKEVLASIVTVLRTPEIPGELKGSQEEMGRQAH